MIRKSKSGEEIKHIIVPFTLIDTKTITEKDSKGVSKKYFTFKGYGSTFGNMDRVREVVVKGCFLESLKEMIPSLLWQHEWDEPVGIFVKIYEDDKGLYVEGKMPLDDDFVRGRVVPQLEIGSVKSMSIGYSTQKYTYDEENDIYYLTKVLLWEISLVTIPANKNAIITDMKSIVPFQDLELSKRSHKWNKKEALERVKEFTESNTSPTESYRKAFLYVDNSDPDNFDSYKMLVADIINNKMVAIPEAIFEATGSLSGNNQEIKGLEKKSLINNINKYYSKMRKDFNDKDLFSPFEKTIEDLSNIREVDNYLKTYGLSTKKCNIIISKIKKFVREGQTIEQETSQRDAELTKFFENVEKLKKL